MLMGTDADFCLYLTVRICPIHSNRIYFRLLYLDRIEMSLRRAGIHGTVNRRLMMVGRTCGKEDRNTYYDLAMF